ncbi:ribosome recycling factor [bacterium]|nr:ribosome recycling factor [bacterium]
MFKTFIDKAKSEFAKSLEDFKGELLKIRTARLSPSLVENIKVNCFGKELPLKNLASIFSNSPRELLLQPWDKIYLESIEKAISDSHLQLSVSVSEGKIILRAPLITADYKKSILKMLAEEKEKARERLRRQREQIWREIQDSFHKKELTEDDKFRAKDKLQEAIDEVNEKIDELSKRKEKEILA